MSTLAPNKYLTLSEQEALFKKLKNIKEERDQVMLLLLIKGGMRAQELLNITKEDFLVDEGAIFIRGLKGSSDRNLPFEKTLFNRAYALACASSDGRPFPICYKRLQAIWYTHRPVSKKLHATRHTFAINLYEKTKDLLLVQYALGHKNHNNTLVYAKHISITKSLREAML